MKNRSLAVIAALLGLTVGSWAYDPAMFQAAQTAAGTNDWTGALTKANDALAQADIDSLYKAYITEWLVQPLQALGRAKEAQAARSAAIPLWQARRDEAGRTLGEKVEACAHLRQLQYDLGDFAAAEQACRDGLTLLADNLFERANWTHWLGYPLDQQSKSKEAKATRLAAVALWRQFLSENPQADGGSRLHCLYNIESVLFLAGDDAGAEAAAAELFASQVSNSDQLYGPLWHQMQSLERQGRSADAAKNIVAQIGRLMRPGHLRPLRAELNRLAVKLNKSILSAKGESFVGPGKLLLAQALVDAENSGVGLPEALTALGLTVPANFAAERDAIIAQRDRVLSGAEDVSEPFTTKLEWYWGVAGARDFEKRYNGTP